MNSIVNLLATTMHPCNHMIKPLALAVILVNSYMPCVHAEKDATTLAERQKRAVQALSQYKGYYFPKEDILTNKHDEVMQNIDTLFQRFAPRYICELARVPDGANIPVLFETELPNGNLWSVNMLDRNALNINRCKGLTRFICHSYFTVIDGGATNCFGSSKADTLVVTTVTGDSTSQTETNRVYFTVCSGYDKPILTRIERDGCPIYYFLTMEDQIHSRKFLNSEIQQYLPASEEKIAANFKIWSPPEILARFMILNTETREYPEDHILRRLQSSESFTQIVGTLLKHPHPWVRAAANDYLVNHSTLGQPRAESK